MKNLLTVLLIASSFCSTSYGMSCARAVANSLPELEYSVFFVEPEAMQDQLGYFAKNYQSDVEDTLSNVLALSQEISAPEKIRIEFMKNVNYSTSSHKPKNGELTYTAVIGRYTNGQIQDPELVPLDYSRGAWANEFGNLIFLSNYYKVSEKYQEVDSLLRAYSQERDVQKKKNQLGTIKELQKSVFTKALVTGELFSDIITVMILRDAEAIANMLRPVEIEDPHVKEGYLKRIALRSFLTTRAEVFASPLSVYTLYYRAKAHIWSRFIEIDSRDLLTQQKFVKSIMNALLDETLGFWSDEGAQYLRPGQAEISMDSNLVEILNDRLIEKVNQAFDDEI